MGEPDTRSSNERQQAGFEKVKETCVISTKSEHQMGRGGCKGSGRIERRALLRQTVVLPCHLRMDVYSPSPVQRHRRRYTLRHRFQLINSHVEKGEGTARRESQVT